MTKVLTFSTTYPAHHPKVHHKTHFVEKIHKGLTIIDREITLTNKDLEPYFDFHAYSNVNPKFHTIRSGHHWKAGDMFSPRIWSGRPRRSKQIIIAPDIKIEKVWGIKFTKGIFYSIDNINRYGETEGDHELLETIAKNDGLSKDDLLDWLQYPKPFDGQIICWNKNIKY